MDSITWLLIIFGIGNSEALCFLPPCWFFWHVFLDVMFAGPNRVLPIVIGTLVRVNAVDAMSLVCFLTVVFLIKKKSKWRSGLFPAASVELQNV